MSARQLRLDGRFIFSGENDAFDLRLGTEVEDQAHLQSCRPKSIERLRNVVARDSGYVEAVVGST